MRKSYEDEGVAKSLDRNIGKGVMRESLRRKFMNSGRREEKGKKWRRGKGRRRGRR